MSVWRDLVHKMNPFRGDNYVRDFHQDSTRSREGKNPSKRPYMRKKAKGFAWGGMQNDVHSFLVKGSRALQYFRKKTGHYPEEGQKLEILFEDGSKAIYEVEAVSSNIDKVDKYAFDCRLVEPIEDNGEDGFPKDVYIGSRTGVFKEE